MPSSLSHAHANIQTHMPPSVPVGEGYYLMESCFIYFFFFSRSYRPFHRHPACPARKTMRAQSLLLGRAPSIFHLRPPTHPQKNNPRCIHTSPMLSQRCLTSIPPHPLSSRLPARPAFGSASTTAGFFFLVISSARSRCARDYCEMKVGGGGREREERRCGAGERK